MSDRRSHPTHCSSWTTSLAVARTYGYPLRRVPAEPLAHDRDRVEATIRELDRRLESVEAAIYELGALVRVGR